MQGGSDPSSAGILPRTLDVIFNSVGHLQSDSKVSDMVFFSAFLTDPII